MAAVILVGLSFAAHPIFQLGGHPPEVQKLERIYFRVLCLGGGFNVLGTCLAGFFTGRGQTRPVMLINIIGMAFNIPLDCALINGVWFFPEMGILRQLGRLDPLRDHAFRDFLFTVPAGQMENNSRHLAG
jgi:MATE family multidrug resistance protein